MMDFIIFRGSFEVVSLLFRSSEGPRNYLGSAQRRKTPPRGNLGVCAMNRRCMPHAMCEMGYVRATYVLAMRFIFSAHRPS